MDEDFKQNLTAAETWIRGLFILLFAFLLMVARIVTAAVVVIQFLFTVFTGRTNENLRYFGAGLAQYIFQILQYVTYNSDEKAFPFSPWPEVAPMVAESGSADDDASATESVEPGEPSQPDEHEPQR
ncbi:MAG: DUF4389 domain-containing protein [Gammaproteobacteria bacterium]|nr:DUF4389 domain-containing protein [Gammaproteobacteria bacterium]